MGDAAAFALDDRPLTALDRDGGLWFPAVEVAALLGVRLSDVLRHAVETDGEATLTSGPACPPGLVISEPALYRAAFAAAPAAGARLRDFVFKVVVPHMRGRAAAAPSVAASDMATATLNANVNLVRLCATLRGKAAANRLWAIMGLPDPGEDPHDEGDTIAAFVRAAVEITRKSSDVVEAGTLYEAFVVYCNTSAITPLGKTTFNRRMPKTALHLGIEKGKSSVSTYVGIVLRDAFRPAGAR